MATLIEIDGVAPTIGRDVFLAPNAVITGDVRIGDRASVWFGAVLRGDISHIEIGEETSIQDGAIVYCDRGHRPSSAARVTVGHNALLEGRASRTGRSSAWARSSCTTCASARARSSPRAPSSPTACAVGARMLAAGVPAREKRALEGPTAGYPEHAADESPAPPRALSVGDRARQRQLRPGAVTAPRSLQGNAQERPLSSDRS